MLIFCCQMNDFDTRTVWDMLPRMKDGYKMDKPTLNTISQMMKSIEAFSLESSPTGNHIHFPPPPLICINFATLKLKTGENCLQAKSHIPLLSSWQPE